METKEAPNKLYITYKGYGVFDEDSTVERAKDSQTEYIRKDAFIEKARKYIANHFLAPGMDNEINDFVNYMKGDNGMSWKCPYNHQCITCSHHHIDKSINRMYCLKTGKEINLTMVLL